MARIRLDKLILKRNLARSIEEALSLLESEMILVDGAIQTNPANNVDQASSVEIKKPKSKYVSRGGLKLEHALEVFNIDLSGRRCLDVGASTGGFTDCMLDKDASYVVAVDVGKGQLDDKIRYHEKVKILEKTNAKDLDVEMIGGKCSFAAIDVSFTSIKNIIDPITEVLDPIEIVALVKPQFEVETKHVNAKGIVTDAQVHVKCINDIQQFLLPKLRISNLTASPIRGTKGNIEFLVHIIDADLVDTQITQSKIEDIVNNAHRETL